VPTPTQDNAEAQDRDFTTVEALGDWLAAPAGIGSACADHVLPRHVSSSA
jgi:hypothetical protein